MAERSKRSRKIDEERRREVRKTKRLLLFGAELILLLVLVVLLVKTQFGSSNSSGQNQSGNTPAGTTVVRIDDSASTVSVSTASTAADTSALETTSSTEEMPEETSSAGIMTSDPQLALKTDDGEEIYFPRDASYTETITILGTGDNIIHEALYEHARTEDGGYDFTSYYSKIKSYVEAADVATVNQEAPLASRYYEVSGYPSFNSPVQTADALIDTGFDLLNFANNHILDMGDSGFLATLEYMNEKGYPYCGAYTDADDRETAHVLEVNGFRVAFVGFLSFTNKDASSDAGSRLIYTWDDERMERVIKTAKEAADIVVVHVHWGEENEAPLTDEMITLSQKIVDWGADLVFGNHTHVVQYMRVLQRSSDGALVPVQFGGGNFLSGQKERAHLLSILTKATFARNPETGDIVCAGLKCLPTVTHYTGDRYDVCIYPLDDYTDELAASNGVKDFEGETMTIDYLRDWIDAEIPSQFIATTETF